MAFNDDLPRQEITSEDQCLHSIVNMSTTLLVLPQFQLNLCCVFDVLGGRGECATSDQNPPATSLNWH
ncbi:hypothetical protein BDZ89DRAFT_1082830 [Hymenopellis radicata]|nr:hypothetical protein BDZ89DRAFT_1082830 [Hymenopellis radicata]